MGAQGVALLVLALVLLLRTVTRDTSEAGRSVTLAVVVLAFALGAGFIARALWGALEAARTPTLLWNVFVVLIGVTLARDGAPIVGVVVALIGVGTLAVGWMATSSRAS